MGVSSINHRNQKRVISSFKNFPMNQLARSIDRIEIHMLRIPLNPDSPRVSKSEVIIRTFEWKNGVSREEPVIIIVGSGNSSFQNENEVKVVNIHKLFAAQSFVRVVKPTGVPSSKQRGAGHWDLEVGVEAFLADFPLVVLDVAVEVGGCEEEGFSLGIEELSVLV